MRAEAETPGAPKILGAPGALGEEREGGYWTFLVAMMSTPVPATSASSTSPIWTGAVAVTPLSAATISKILPFGISCAVFQLTTHAPVRLPVSRTVLVTMRVGFVTSFLA